MRYGIIALTRGGLDLAERVRRELPSSALYTVEKLARGDCTIIGSPFPVFVGTIFRKHRVLIFITAAGIAVRGIARHITDKTSDPAVLVMDEGGRFVISLLSGHLGGANEEAHLVAERCGAMPVITTSSDVQGLPSVDMMAKRHGLRMESLHAAREITSLLVNGDPVALVNDTGLEFPGPFTDDPAGARGIIYISNRVREKGEIPSVTLVPENIIIGIGCRRGVPAAEIIGFIGERLESLSLRPESIRRIATAQVKGDEEGIRRAAEHFGRELAVIPMDEIRRVEERFDKSEYVMKAVGVHSVAEPCAYLASNGSGRMLMGREKKNGITAAIWEEEVK